MTSQERFSNVHAQLEHLQSKYVGTGHSDTTKLCARARPTPTRTLVGRGGSKTRSARSRAPPPHARSEWGVNQHRDSLALYAGFDSLSHHIAIAENESVGRVKFNCLQKMIQPCGPPPPKEED